MLLRLKKNASAAELESLQAYAKQRGYESRVLDRGRRILELTRLADGAAPEVRAGDRSAFEDRSCVEGVLDGTDAPELHERAAGRSDTRVRVGEALFGAGSVSLIAGPCALEDEERVVEIARAVHAAGATVLRGGAFKPRTSPYSFQGLGDAGLRILERVKAEVGIAVVTEVLDPRDVERVSSVADMLQIGSRSMSSGALLVEAGRSGLPVMLKRGMAATAREFLLAAEYVLAQGNTNVLLCERGLRGFDSATRNVLDLGTVAHLKRATHLPVIVDPSHAAGRGDLVPPLARAGIAAGADGLIVEVHPRPSEVRSDGAQAISPEEFASLVEGIRGLVALDGRALVTRPTTAPLPLEQEEVAR